MQLQHVNVKLLVEDGAGFHFEPLIPIFHNWIEKQLIDAEMLIDVADYSHVPAGPGVVLVGHEANYSVDNAGSRLGVRYNRKMAVEGGNQACLAQAARAALRACERLEAEPRLDGKIRFNGQEIEIFVNDRLVAPNTNATRDAFDSDFRAFLDKLFGGGNYSLSYEQDSRSLFTAYVKASRSHSVSELIEALR